MKTSKIKWTSFMDMHSGGGQKEKFAYCFIEAPEDEARVIFFNRFGHSPDRVSCTCCGNDYSISEDESLEQATAYQRNCAYAYFDKKGNEVPEYEAWTSGKGLRAGYTSGYAERLKEGNEKYKEEWAQYCTLEEYLKKKSVHVIYARDIKPEERKGEIPEQGYVWVD
jgi:hypothetical protein